MALCEAHGLPAPETEHKFHPTRKWRLDYAWAHTPMTIGEPWRLAVEVEGGLFVGGRHGRGAGARNDMIKYEAALNYKWIVYRVLPEWLGKQSTIDTIRGLLA